MIEYISDIEQGEKERVLEKINEDIHKGIIAIYKNYVAKNSFSESASMACPDNMPGICGFNEKQFLELAKGKIPKLDLEKYDDEYMILDFVQFCHFHVKKANRDIRIPYIHGLTGDEAFAQSYTFDESDEEKENFKNDINTLFRRNGLVFELKETGKIERIVPSGLVPLASKLYKTSDTELNQLIDEAFDNFSKLKVEDRRVAVDKIWDAFDRMKTYYQDKNTKDSISTLIQEVSGGNSVIIEILETEANMLRDIGNGKRIDKTMTGLAIRHNETTKVRIDNNEYIDILFYRMASFMQLFLKHLEKSK